MGSRDRRVPIRNFDWAGILALNAVLDPLVNALYATPRIALMPLIIILVRTIFPPTIAIHFLVDGVQILVNTMTVGFSTWTRISQGCRVLGATMRKYFYR